MNELISRSWLLSEYDKRHKGPPGGARKLIEEAPSALGTDCISRQDAIDALRNYLVGKNVPCDGTLTARLIENEVVNKLPSAQPEIIRCKDCKHWIPYDWMFSEVWQSKNMADYPEDEIGCDCSEMAMKANDFCSRAERRTE